MNEDGLQRTGQSFAERFVAEHPTLQLLMPSQEVLQRIFGRDKVPRHIGEVEQRNLASEAYSLFIKVQEIKKFLQQKKRKKVNELLHEAQTKLDNGELKPISDLAEVVAIGIAVNGSQVTAEQAQKAAIRKYLKAGMANYGQDTVAVTLNDRRKLIARGDARALRSSLQKETAVPGIVAQSQLELKNIEQRLLDILSVPGVLEQYKRGFEQEMSAIKSAQEVMELRALEDILDQEEDKLQREAWSGGYSLTVAETQFIQDNIILKKTIQQRIADLLKSSEVVDSLRTLQLKEYAKQLAREGFVETPSRTELVKKIRAQIAKGAKIILIGETGTGKTELWFHSALSLFGTKGGYVTGGPDLNAYQLYGRVGIGKQEDGERGDVFRPGELTRSFIGNGGRGTPFLFDELDNAKPEAVMGMKTHMNAEPGDEVSIQVNGDETYTIGPDWAFGATANMKSSRYKTRQDIDPAVKRVLKPIGVDYIPAAEQYDIFLAAMLDSVGGIPISKVDAEKTLKQYTDAMEWIQNAFQEKPVIIDASSGRVLPDRNGATTDKPATLKEAILDTGRALKMLSGYEKSRAQGLTLRQHLNNELFGFVTDRSFSQDDKYYLIQIFTLKGFFDGADWTAVKFGISGLNQNVFSNWQSKKTDSRDITAIQNSAMSRKEVARLDPYKKLGQQIELSDLLDEEEDRILVTATTIPAVVEPAPTVSESPFSSYPRLEAAISRLGSITKTESSGGSSRANIKTYFADIQEMVKKGEIPVDVGESALQIYVNEGIYLEFKNQADSIIQRFNLLAKNWIDFDSPLGEKVLAMSDITLPRSEGGPTTEEINAYFNGIKSLLMINQAELTASITVLQDYVDRGIDQNQRRHAKGIILSLTFLTAGGMKLDSPLAKRVLSIADISKSSMSDIGPSAEEVATYINDIKTLIITKQTLPALGIKVLQDYVLRGIDQKQREYAQELIRSLSLLVSMQIDFDSPLGKQVISLGNITKTEQEGGASISNVANYLQKVEEIFTNGEATLDQITVMLKDYIQNGKLLSQKQAATQLLIRITPAT